MPRKEYVYAKVRQVAGALSDATKDVDGTLGKVAILHAVMTAIYLILLVVFLVMESECPTSAGMQHFRLYEPKLVWSDTLNVAVPHFVLTSLANTTGNTTALAYRSPVHTDALATPGAIIVIMLCVSVFCSGMSTYLAYRLHSKNAQDVKDRTADDFDKDNWLSLVGWLCESILASFVTWFVAYYCGITNAISGVTLSIAMIGLVLFNTSFDVVQGYRDARKIDSATIEPKDPNDSNDSNDAERTKDASDTKKRYKLKTAYMHVVCMLFAISLFFHLLIWVYIGGYAFMSNPPSSVWILYVAEALCFIGFLLMQGWSALFETSRNILGGTKKMPRLYFIRPVVGFVSRFTVIVILGSSIVFDDCA
jgi:hypothetical protein